MIITVNNIKSKIEYERADYSLNSNIHKVFRKKFREKLPNQQFNTNRFGDGYTYFITDKLQQFATGLLPLIIKYAESLGLSVTLVDKRKNLPAFKKEFTTKIDEKYSLLEHQIKPAKSINRYVNSLFFPRGILNLSMNAGKTFIIGNLYQNLEKPKVLFLIDSSEIFDQALEFFSSFIKDVGIIGRGKFIVGETFTMAMAKTLHDRLTTHKDRASYMKAIADINVLVVDECHKAISNTYKKVLGKINAGARIFMSGTPFLSGNDIDSVRLVGNSSNQIAKITEKELQDLGISRKLEVKVHLSCTKTNALAYSYHEAKRMFLYHSKERNKKIHEIILASKGEPVLIAVDKSEHGLAILEYLQSIEDYHIPTDFVDGGGGAKNRKEKFEQFKTGELKVLISTGILKAGVNMAFVFTTILAMGEKSGVTLGQWRGRFMRLNPKYTLGTVHDFYDIGKYVEKHSKDRIEQYKKVGYDIDYQFDITKVKHLSNKNFTKSVK